jgi:hypothetical protein
MTRRNMEGLATILRWKDPDGSHVFNVDEMVSFKTLGKVIDQLPLLKTYTKKVTVDVKGKKTTAVLATHSLDDVTRRLLQMVPLEVMAFHARDGHTRYTCHARNNIHLHLPSLPTISTNFWHGDYFRTCGRIATLAAACACALKTAPTW